MRLPILRLLFVLATLSLVGNLYAETAVVSGTITHRNGKPAVNVTVSIAGLAGLTDVRGRYRIPGIPPGRQSLRILQNNRVLKQLVVNVSAPATIHNETIP